jgi:CRP-like cAMP-binding protein
MVRQDEDIEVRRDQLRKFFLQLEPNTPLRELNELVEQFSLHRFQKKEMILEAGDFSEMVYFVCEGLVRIYYTSEEKEITNWFIRENMIFAATYSILTGEKNYNYYESLENTLVLKIKYSQLESFYTRFHSLEHIGRKLIESYYGAFMRRTHDVLFLSAEERYHLFLKDHHRDVMNRVPLRHIASYLGITQETLSRLRAKH